MPSRPPSSTPRRRPGGRLLGAVLACCLGPGALAPAGAGPGAAPPPPGPREAPAQASPAQAAPSRESWSQEKCARYRKGWSELLARRGARGLGPEFLDRHEAFLASGCTARGDVCPRSGEELEVANILTILAMNAGTASTFLPFACRPREPAAPALAPRPQTLLGPPGAARPGGPSIEDPA